MNMTDLEMDLLLAQAEVATLKRASAGNMFTVPDDYVKVLRCKDCKQSKAWQNQFGHEGFMCNLLCIDISPNDYCSFGDQKDGDNHG